MKITPDLEEKWIKKVLEEKDSIRYAIQYEGQYIGNIQLTSINEKEKKAELHIFIGEQDCWGKGIGKLATAMFIDEIKSLRDLQQLYLFVHPDNRAAIRLYRSLGFEFTKNDDYKMILEL